MKCKQKQTLENFKMGSKKLKRKKLKYKKLEKYCKLTSVKREKSLPFDSFTGLVNSQEKFKQKNIENRWSQKQSYQFCNEEKDVSDIKYFSKVRESYFKYLQTVVSDNCMLYGSVVAEEILENLVLELEQNALLACLQVDIYQKAMLKIIKDIIKCTEENQVHKDVKKLLPETIQDADVQVSRPKPISSLPIIEGYCRIPTVSSARANCSMESTSLWPEQTNFSSDAFCLVTEEKFTENQRSTDSYHLVERNTFSTTPDDFNYWSSNKVPQPSSSNTSIFDNTSVISNGFSTTIDSCNDLNTEVNGITSLSSLIKEKKETADPLLESRKQLQKLIEHTLLETEKIKKQKRDEQEKAYITQILEGDDSLDDRFNDSLSDNDTESKENIDDSNLMDRLEKMRKLFGVEVEQRKIQNGIFLEKQKSYNKVNQINNRSRRPTIWKHEKFIQLHKYSIIAAEMTLERRQRNKKLFLGLFGEDSDDEHEHLYSSTEKFRSNCTERISSWVVKYLMPFYLDKRIHGRNLFKYIGHYISDTIVDKIQYPDEWTVKYLVSKFFPPKKKYVCEADILNFQLD